MSQRACEFCGRPIVPKVFTTGLAEDLSQAARRRFCGQPCAGKSRLRPFGPPTEEQARATAAAEAERFFAFVSPEPMSGCWLWTGSYTRAGYGQFMPSHGQRPVLAHRWSLEFSLGVTLLPHILGCHRCDNPPCVNPQHLYAGSALDNARDAIERGQAARGSRKGNAKLTESDVVKIRAACRDGEKQRSVAERFGVDNSIVSLIMGGHIWTHVREEVVSVA